MAISSTNVIINDTLPRTQLIATGGQTVYSTDWTADYTTDVVVYSRATGVLANDVTQKLLTSQYNVAFIGALQIVQVTLITPSTAGDIVTITRMTPADRENLYTNTNFTPSMLNNDFGILTLVDQQAQLYNQQITPHYNVSDIIQPITDTILPVLALNQTWVKNSANTAITTITLGTAAPQAATNPALPYVASVSGSFVSGNVVVANDVLGTIRDGGYVAGTVSQINTGTGLVGGPITTTGTISYAPINPNSLWVNNTGSIAVPQVVSTSLFLKSANNLNDLNNTVIAVNNLGLTIGTFTQAYSPFLTTIATAGSPIGVTLGGTGKNSFTPNAVICGGTTATGALQSLTNGLEGQVLTSNGSALLPTWQFGPNAVTPSQIQNQTYVYSLDTGAANTYVATPTVAVDPYVAGLRIVLKVANTNSGASTLNVSGLGPIAIKTTGLTDLVAGQMTTGMLADLEYDGTQFQILNPFLSSNGIVNTGLINQLAYYPANGASVVGLPTANDGTLITSAAGVPSISSTLPLAVQSNVTQLGVQTVALNMGTHQINNLVDPSVAQDAATKNYVDQTALNGTSVFAATAANLTVTQSGSGIGATLTNAGVLGVFTIDSVQPPVGVPVMIKNIGAGGTSANYGIYTVTNVGSIATNFVLTRATSYDTPLEINETGLILINNGATLAGQAWYNSANIITVDTTPFVFSRFGTTGTVTSVTAGANLTGGTITTSGTIALNSSVSITNLNVSTQTLIGTTTATTGFGPFQSTAISTSSSVASITYSATGGQGALFYSAKSAGTSVNSYTALSNGDVIGQWQSYGTDGSNFIISSRILNYVDGAVSTGIVPGGIRLSTANSASAIINALTINSQQQVSLANPLAVASGGTGAITAPAALTSLGAAARGANSDITSLSGLTTPLSVSRGGTGATTVNAAGINLQDTGTFTPILTSSIGSFGAITYIVQVGSYTRIGKLVNFTLDLQASSIAIGTASGLAQISGLPFPIQTSVAAFNFIVGVQNVTFTGSLLAFNISSSAIIIAGNISGSTYTTVSPANLGTPLLIRISGVYTST